MSKNKIKNQRGVTLLEIVVAISLFAFLVITITEIFQSIMKSQKNIIANQSLDENMMYIFEVMSREIRMAQRDYEDPLDACIASSSGRIYYATSSILYFRNQYGECVRYFANNKRLYIYREDSATSTPITPNNIKIENLKFFNFGNLIENSQEMVHINMDAYIDNNRLESAKTIIQMSITSRYYITE